MNTYNDNITNTCKYLLYNIVKYRDITISDYIITFFGAQYVSGTLTSTISFNPQNNPMNQVVTIITFISIL